MPWGKSKNFAGCENSSKFNKLGRAILPPGCGGEKATVVLIIDDDGETNFLLLCEECATVIAKDAIRHDYKVRRRKL